MDPQSQTQPHASQSKKKLLVILGGVCAFFMIVLVMFYFQSQSTTKPSTPTDFRRVSAQGVSIILHGGGLDYSSSVVASSDPYPLTVTNNSGSKQGVYIPSKNITIVLENGTSDTSKTILFDTPGEYEFLPSVYQTGWEIWKGKILVTAAVTNTPVPSSTTAPSLTTVPSITTTPSLTPVPSSTVAPITQGLVGYWDFNETSGNMVNDKSGNGFHGQWSGTGSHYVPGVSGSAATFNGTDDYVGLPSITADFSRGFTAQFWRKSDRHSSQSPNVTLNMADVGRRYWLEVDQDGNYTDYYSLLVSDNDPLSLEYYSLEGDQRSYLMDSNWQLITFVVDTNGVATMYRNGTSQQTNQGFSLPINTVWSRTRIGSSVMTPDVNAGFIYGALDEFKLYNRPKTAVEILADYQSLQP